MRLTVEGDADDKELSKAISKFFRLLRRELDCECDYFAIAEWADGQRHLHILVRVPEGVRIPTKLVGELWARSVPRRRTTHYSARVENQTAIAKYVAKDLKNWKVELPPETFRGRLFSNSIGFFSNTKAMCQRGTLVRRQNKDN